MGKSTISNAMFNSYVRLPEGRSHQNHPKPTVPDPSVKFNQFNLDQLAVRLLIDRSSSSSEGLSHPRPYLQGNSTQFFQQTWLESRVWQWSVYPPKKHHWWITIGRSPLVDHHVSHEMENLHRISHLLFQQKPSGPEKMFRKKPWSMLSHGNFFMAVPFNPFTSPNPVVEVKAVLV